MSTFADALTDAIKEGRDHERKHTLESVLTSLEVAKIFANATGNFKQALDDIEESILKRLEAVK